MSTITNRNKTPRDAGAVENRLTRLLEGPSLARIVPHLPPETLHRVIRHRGLDACGELVTLATPAQLTSVLDLDLWRPARPGRDQQFDVDRFGEWLQVLVDTGDSVAARTVAALDANLVIAGLCRCVRVFDPGIFEPTAQSDDEPTDRHGAMREGDGMTFDAASGAESMYADDEPVHDLSGSGLECEVGGYMVRARRADAWDAIVTLLVTLDAEHGRYFHTVMQGCRQFSNSRSELDGLDDLLPPPEQHLHEVTIGREERRAQQGYATPGDARAFLEMARQPKHTRSEASVHGPGAVNPIVAAYFRAAGEAPEWSDDNARPSEGTTASASPPVSRPAFAAGSQPTNHYALAAEVPESLEAVLELLTEAGLMPERPRALLEGGGGDPQAAGLTHLRRLLAYVRDTHASAYFTRGGELAFLANTLLAGCSVQSRTFTPQEASNAAAAVCNLGLEYWPSRWPGGIPQGSSSERAQYSVTAPSLATFPPDSLLMHHDLVTAFEVGWSVLHHDVSLFAAEQLIGTLSAVDCVDRDTQRGLATLRRTLLEQRDRGTPWRARRAAEVLGTLDMTAWIGVLGLLDECPVLAAALMAVLEGRTTRVSPTEFAFISTAAQVSDAHRFVRKLPHLLSR